MAAGKGRGAKPGRGGKPPKRTPPPDDTGKELEYLEKTKTERVPVSLKLIDGQLVQGVIEYYDVAMIKITADDGPNLFVRKDQIRYLWETEESG